MKEANAPCTGAGQKGDRFHTVALQGGMKKEGSLVKLFIGIIAK